MIARAGITTTEIAELYGRQLSTVQQSWTRHPQWPAPIGKRGRWREYDRTQVDDVVRRLFLREPPTPAGRPGDLLTAAEIADYTGVAYSTIRSYISRGRFAAHDEIDDSGVKLWRRSTVDTEMATRRRRAKG